MPWDQRPSIYDHIRSHVPADGIGLSEGGETLPDEDRVNAGSKIRRAAGAMDGVLSHHMGQRPSPLQRVQSRCVRLWFLEFRLHQMAKDAKQSRLDKVGSQMSGNERNSCPDAIKSLRQDLVEQGIAECQGEHFIFKADYAFNSPSMQPESFKADQQTGELIGKLRNIRIPHNSYVHLNSW